jgi:hypothetical protein
MFPTYGRLSEISGLRSPHVHNDLVKQIVYGNLSFAYGFRNRVHSDASLHCTPLHSDGFLIIRNGQIRPCAKACL